MHVAQIAVAVTRDLITKYHYFHTSFQIWPDQIKVRARGRENCTLRWVVHPGVAAKPGLGRGSAQGRCPRGHCRKGDSSGPGILQSGGCGRIPGDGKDPLKRQISGRSSTTLPFTRSTHQWLKATHVSVLFLPQILLEHHLCARPRARP